MKYSKLFDEWRWSEEGAKLVGQYHAWRAELDKSFGRYYLYVTAEGVKAYEDAGDENSSVAELYHKAEHKIQEQRRADEARAERNFKQHWL